MCQQNKHVGFHEMTTGGRYNPDCPVCRGENYQCPLGLTLEKVDCTDCVYGKEGLCDYPFARTWQQQVESNDILRLAELAKVRDKAQDKLAQLIWGWLDAIY